MMPACRSFLKYFIVLILVPTDVLPMDQSRVVSCQPILQATRSGDIETVSALIFAAEDLFNFRDEDKNTLLIIACKNNRYQLVQYLINLGSCVNEVNKFKQTALHFAAINGNEDLVRLLVQCRAKILPDIQGKTPLDYARALKINIKTLEMLQACETFDGFMLSSGADQFSLPMCLIDCAQGLFYDARARSPIEPSLQSMHLPLISLNLSHEGISLRDAIRGGDFDAIVTLLALCEDINAPIDEQNNTPLHCLVQAGILGLKAVDTLVLLCLEKGALPDALNIHRQTPLHLAISICNPLEETALDVVAKLLIEHGASVNVPDAQGQTPLFLASRNKNERLIQLLAGQGAYIAGPECECSTAYLCERMRNALSHRSLQEIQEVIADGFDVNDPLDNRNNRALHYVIGTNNNELKAVRLLLSFGANPNLVNACGKTPLHEAFYSGRINIVSELLSFGVNGVILDNLGRSPIVDLVARTKRFRDCGYLVGGLNEAVADDDIQKATRCIMSGADLNQSDSVGMRPLHWATTNQNTALARLLLKRGANLSLTDGNGSTPVEYALENRCAPLENLLMWHINQRSRCCAAFKNAGPSCLRHLVKCSLINCPIDEEGNYPLHYAVNRGVAESNVQNNIVLQRESMDEVVKYLIRNGARVNVQNVNGHTPLLRAFMTGNRRLFNLFLAHGADANIYAPDGKNVCVRLACLLKSGKW